MAKCFLYLFIIVIVCSCQQQGAKQYEKLEKKELASSRRVDSIFFGLYFGMKSKQFFSYCWQMSKKGIFTDGLNNQYVLHKLDNGELKHEASMNFYPDFFDDKIFRMRVLYQYSAWAPWNKGLYSDSLLNDVLQLYQKQYPGGNPFIAISEKNRPTVYAKVDGNRRITIGILNDGTVKAIFTDLIVEQQIEKKDADKK
ncbi:MAG TPA: hypothetical protein VG738_17510 [Chitinophagaceae bacterium]|nr:hypothetical protein [Chitinophagaceae bacterium]